jgi:hypothetical protein
VNTDMDMMYSYVASIFFFLHPWCVRSKRVFLVFVEDSGLPNGKHEQCSL